MRRLVKSHDASWLNGSRSSVSPSNLDHVVATTNLACRQYRQPAGGYAEVSVRGWVTKFTDGEKDTWSREYSNHSLLFFEVMACRGASSSCRPSGRDAASCADRSLVRIAGASAALPRAAATARLASARDA
jgi:hypothetical protein